MLWLNVVCCRSGNVFQPSLKERHHAATLKRMWMLVASVSSAFHRAPCWILSGGLSHVIHLGKSKFGRITWTKPALPAEGDLAKLLCSSRDFRGQSDGQMGRCNTSPVICVSSRLNSKGQDFAPPCRWYSRVDKNDIRSRKDGVCMFISFVSFQRTTQAISWILYAVCVYSGCTYQITLSLFHLGLSPPTPSMSLHIWHWDVHPNWESWQSCIFPFWPWWGCWLLYWHLSMLIRSKRTRQRFHTVLKSN